VGLLSLLSLARCSLTSLDGLTGGDHDASTLAISTGQDAGAPTSSGNPSDASSAADVTMSPAPKPDASASSPPDGGASSIPSDAGTDSGVPLFHDDFEGSQPLPRAWDLMTTTGGALDLDPSLFVSPTTSLRATSIGLDAGAPGDAVNVTLRKLFTLPPAGTTMAYAFEAYPRQYDATANAVIGALQISDGAGDLYELQLDVQKNAAGALSVIFAEYTGFADGGTAYVPHPIPGSLAVGTWTSIRIELVLVQPPLARVFFDGSLQLETSVTPTIAGTAVQISLGLSYASAPTEAWVVNYDDATYSLAP
jgi:hypothetical protein